MNKLMIILIFTLLIQSISYASKQNGFENNLMFQHSIQQMEAITRRADINDDEDEDSDPDGDEDECENNTTQPLRPSSKEESC